jgi:hypothetical protein
MQRTEEPGDTKGFYTYDVRLVSDMLEKETIGTVLHGYLDLFLFYLMIHNGSGYVDWVV